MSAQLSDASYQLPQTPALRDGGIDAGLYVLDVTGKGRGLSQKDIAFVCGCSHTLIWNLEQRAIGKLKKQLRRKGYRSVKDFLEESE